MCILPLAVRQIHKPKIHVLYFMHKVPKFNVQWAKNFELISPMSKCFLPKTKVRGRIRLTIIRWVVEHISVINYFSFPYISFNFFPSKLLFQNLHKQGF